MDGLFALYLFSILTLPGFAICLLARVENSRGLLSVALSYSLIVFAYMGGRYFGAPLASIFTTLEVVTAASLAFVLVCVLRRKASITAAQVASGLAIVFTVLVFHALFGPYAEIPADMFAHMERVQLEMAQMINVSAGAASLDGFKVTDQSRAWYALLAAGALWADATGSTILSTAPIVSNSIFLLCVFWFSKSIFQDSMHCSAIATISVLLVALHMGVNVFSFVRYYALAPTMLGFCLYFSAISLILTLLQTRFSAAWLVTIVMLLALTLAAAVNHNQEALFIAVMGGMLIATKSIPYFNSDKNAGEILWLWRASTVAMVIFFCAAYLYSQAHFERAPNAHWRLWDFGSLPGFLPDLTVLNMKKQGISVLTLWGLVVYALFFLNWNRYRHNIFVIAGMLSPLATFLNPFFVDLFLRFDNSTTLWRMVYLIPIHFVGADLLVHYVNRLRQSQTLGSTSTLVNVAILCGLVIPLAPIVDNWNSVHYTRWASLRAVPVENSSEHLGDLLQFLDAQKEPKQILTDPFTGYVVSALTQHRSERRKFFRSPKFKTFSFTNYDSRPLDRYRGYLLITNLRTKAKSRIGKLSNHWHERELANIKHYYPPQLFEHLKGDPDKFVLVWTNDEIEVYQIN